MSMAMESNLFGDAKLPLKCQGCGESMDTKVSDLQQNPNVACPNCGAVTHVEAGELHSALAKINQAADELGKTLRRLSK
jgi:uncharacterized Zn finger protein